MTDELQGNNKIPTTTLDWYIQERGRLMQVVERLEHQVEYLQKELEKIVIGRN